jgi:anti-sigma regulatory factor (Ser/Thr protein kinase)
MLDISHRQHLPARRYTSHEEQQDAVNAVVDVVLRNMDLRRDLIAGLEWSVNEITDNVLNHAEAARGGIVQVSTFREEHKIRFVVADAGRGIPAAMRAAFPRLGNDATALEEAVKVGVTSVPESGQGNGLAGSLRIATYSEGSFKITSGKAQLNVYRDPRIDRYRTKKTRAPAEFRFPGTAVMVELSTTAQFAIEEALGLSGAPRVEVPDVVDFKYSSDDGGLIIRMSEESLGFGTRHAGVELRRKCSNLLMAEPSKRLVLDWSCVPLISSSFADEAIGKLFVELGPLAFGERIANVNAEPLVRSLIDRAVMQRVSQALEEGSS